MGNSNFNLIPKRLKDFNPQKSLTELPIFTDTLCTGLILTLGTAAIIKYNSNLSEDYSYAGFNNAIEFFKVPLGILAVTISIIVLIATIHRSAQANEQIKISDKQNKFSNHFKHLEEFEKYIKYQEEHGDQFIKRKRKLHAQLFPDSKSGIYDLSKEDIEETQRLTNIFCSTYVHIAKLEKAINEPHNFDRKITEDICQQATRNSMTYLYMQTEELKRKYHIEEKTKKVPDDFISINHSEIELENSVGKDTINTLNFLVEIFKFEESYSPSRMIEALIETKLSGSPEKAAPELHKIAEFIPGLFP